MGATLPKSERLCSKKDIGDLINGGRWGVMPHIRFCWRRQKGTEDEEKERVNRILISVPKRYFKRAVKRNLLKRRMREAYRVRKDLIPPVGVDIMFTYQNTEIADSSVVASEIESAMLRITDQIKK